MSMPAFVAAVESRSVDALRAAISPSFAGKANGRPLDREAQVRMIESFWAGFSDGAFKVEATGGGGHGVMTWTFAGTHDGIYLGVPPSGTKITLSGFTIAAWNATGFTSLDWKWDAKAFITQVLGPEDLEGAFPLPPQHRPDPSIRWAREAQRQHGRGRKSGQRKPKGRQGQPPGQRPPRARKPSETQASHGAAPAPAEDAPRPPAEEAAASPPEPQPEPAPVSGPSDEAGSSSP
jgi:predicted ester cyclase